MNRPLKILFAMGLLTLCALACNASLPQTQPSPTPTHSVTIDATPTLVSNHLPETDGDVPRVSLENAKAAYDSNQAVFIDVRSPAAFAESHVKGSISIPLAYITADPNSVTYDKAQWIITYCT